MTRPLCSSHSDAACSLRCATSAKHSRADQRVPSRIAASGVRALGEQSRIFEACWFCCVRSADLPRPGDFETIQIDRESLPGVLFTNRSHLANTAGTRYRA
jgi:hypothetical protein